MEDKIGRFIVSFISFIPFHVLVGVRKSIGILMCKVGISKFHVASVKQTFSLILYINHLTPSVP